MNYENIGVLNKYKKTCKYNKTNDKKAKPIEENRNQIEYYKKVRIKASQNVLKKKEYETMPQTLKGYKSYSEK